MPLTLFTVGGNSGIAMAIGKIACLEVAVDGAGLETISSGSSQRGSFQLQIKDACLGLLDFWKERGILRLGGDAKQKKYCRISPSKA